MRTREGEKESDILKAAIRCFAAQGFHATGVARIAQEAGISSGTVYLYFATKEQILVRLFGDLFRELDEQLQRTRANPFDAGPIASPASPVPEPPPTAAQAEQLLRQLLSHFAERPDLTRLYLREQALYHELAGADELPWHQLVAHLESFFQRGLRAGLFSHRLSPVAVRHFVLGGVRAMVQLGLQGEFNPRDREAWLNNSIQLILHGLARLPGEERP